MMQLTADLVRMTINRRLVAVDRVLARLMVRRGCGGVGAQGWPSRWLGPGAVHCGGLRVLCCGESMVSRVTEAR